MAKKDAVVLAINDRDDSRTTLISRIHAAEVSTVVAPITFQALAEELTNCKEPYSLIILDYDLQGWGFKTIETVLTQLRSHPASSSAPLVVLSAFASYARLDPLLAGVDDIVDATTAGTDGVREIIKKYIE